MNNRLEEDGKTRLFSSTLKQAGRSGGCVEGHARHVRDPTRITESCAEFFMVFFLLAGLKRDFSFSSSHYPLSSINMSNAVAHQPSSLRSHSVQLLSVSLAPSAEHHGTRSSIVKRRAPVGFLCYYCQLLQPSLHQCYYFSHRCTSSCRCNSF